MKFSLSAAVILFSVIAAFLLVRKEKRHCENLDKCIKFIEDVRVSAERFSESFSTILISAGHSGNYSKLDFIDKYIETINNGEKPPVAWNDSIINSRINLLQWEKDVLLEFGNKMFFCSCEEISGCCDYAVSQLRQFKENAIQKRDNTSKTSAVCTVSAGIMTAMLIL